MRRVREPSAVGQRLAQRLVGGGERQRPPAGRAPRRRQSSDPTAPPASPAAAPRASTSPSSLPVACSRPLAQMTTGLPVAAGCGPAAGDRAHVLRRRHHQHDVAARRSSASSAVARRPGVERHARQERACWRALPLISATTSVSRAHSSASRPASAQRLRQRRPPRPAADDADAVEGHAVLSCALSSRPGAVESRDPRHQRVHGSGVPDLSFAQAGMTRGMTITTSS